jgi:hypothetical protein
MKRRSNQYYFGNKSSVSIIFYIILFALLLYLIIPHTTLYYKKSIFSPFTERLNQQDIILVKGEVFGLHVMNINKRVSFTSTDIKVADVNIFGKVFAYRCGTTFIKAKVDDKVLKCRVRVISINKNNLVLKVGKSSRLKVKGISATVHWSSKDKSVAVINRFGKVTAISKGTTKMYGKVKGKTITCNIRVK